MQLGWDEFPRLSLPADADDIYDHLGQCRLEAVSVEPVARTVTVTLRDHESTEWRFTFGEVEMFCDASRKLADEVDGDLGIWSLEASSPFPRGGRQVRLFMLEGNVNLSLYAPSVVVTRNGA